LPHANVPRQKDFINFRLIRKRLEDSFFNCYNPRATEK
jgi:hypothetical protein